VAADLLSGAKGGICDIHCAGVEYQRRGIRLRRICSTFSVRADYLAQFQVQKVGGETALEYWIPAELLKQFNENIVGAIEVISRHEDKYGDSELRSE
jgi:hypothetical protein